MAYTTEEKQAFLKTKYKAIFLKKLFENHQNAAKAINLRYSLKINGKVVDGIRISILDNDNLEQFKNAFDNSNNQEQEIITNNNRYWLDKNRTQTGCGIQFYKNKDRLNQISLWKKMVIESIVFNAVADVQTIMHAEISDDLLDIGQDPVLAKSALITSLSEELEKFSCEAYIEPTISNCINQSINFSLDIDKNKIESANIVFDTYVSQIERHSIPQKFHAQAEELLKDTAKGLLGNFNQASYENKIKQLPKEHTWANILGGAALCFLAATLVAAAITVAVTSFGVATPLSAAVLAVATNVAIAGVTIAVVPTASITAATLATGALIGCGFFAGSKTPIALAKPAKEFLKAETHVGLRVE